MSLLDNNSGSKLIIKTNFGSFKIEPSFTEFNDYYEFRLKAYKQNSKTIFHDKIFFIYFEDLKINTLQYYIDNFLKEFIKSLEDTCSALYLIKNDKKINFFAAKNLLNKLEKYQEHVYNIRKL